MIGEIINEKTKEYLKAIGCKATTYFEAYKELCNLAIEIDVKSCYYDDGIHFYVTICKVYTGECYDTVIHDNPESALDEAVEIIYKYVKFIHYE